MLSHTRCLPTCVNDNVFLVAAFRFRYLCLAGLAGANGEEDQSGNGARNDGGDSTRASGARCARIARAPLLSGFTVAFAGQVWEPTEEARGGEAGVCVCLCLCTCMHVAFVFGLEGDGV